MGEEHLGSCLCGGIRLRVLGTLRGVIYCHCSQCRKQSGHFFAATSAAVSDLSVTGEDLLTWYAASEGARRGFCRVCGSALFWKRVGADEVSILAGAFENPTGLKGEMHVYVADKGDYYEIEDGLPQDPAWG